MNIPKKLRAFSLAEVTVVMLLVTVFIIVTAPVATVRFRDLSELDSNTQACVVKQSAGSISLPFDKNKLSTLKGSSNNLDKACASAVENCTYDKANSCQTIKSYVDGNNAGYQNAARKLLRAACDIGGSSACSYFADKCMENAGNCDLSASDYDLNYYLTTSLNNINPGRLKVQDIINDNSEVNDLTNIFAQTRQACVNSPNSAACYILVTNCNNASSNACKAGYAANLNMTCKQIKNSMTSAKSGIYNITAGTNGDGTSIPVYCDMDTDGGGWTRIEYASDLPYKAQFSGGDAWRWIPTDFQTVLTADKILAVQVLSTEGKQDYVALCNGSIQYYYNDGVSYGDAVKFKFINGTTTPYAQQSYSPFNITVTQDGCAVNSGEGGQLSRATIFQIKDKNVPVVNVYTVDNGDGGEYFGSPLTQYPAWLR